MTTCVGILLCGLMVLHSKKEKVTLTLLRLSQLQPNDTMSLPIELPFLLCIRHSMCAMCRVSPEHNQSNVCYGRNLTCDG